MNHIKSKKRVADHGEVFTPPEDARGDVRPYSLFADLGMHEIFAPIETYPPMNVSDLAPIVEQTEL